MWKNKKSKTSPFLCLLLEPYWSPVGAQLDIHQQINAINSQRECKTWHHEQSEKWFQDVWGSFATFTYSHEALEHRPSFLAVSKQPKTMRRPCPGQRNWAMCWWLLFFFCVCYCMCGVLIIPKWLIKVSGHMQHFLVDFWNFPKSTKHLQNMDPQTRYLLLNYSKKCNAKSPGIFKDLFHISTFWKSTNSKNWKVRNLKMLTSILCKLFTWIQNKWCLRAMVGS